jgi:tRNA(fMet)-specific endonuclease VapC
VNYLLDTNACIALVNGSPPNVRPRLEKVLRGRGSVAVSAVVAFELWYGAAKSARRQANRQRLETFFAGPLDLVAFDDEDARVAGEIRATLEVAGTPIGAYDLLIAGQALRYDATLVTANTAEFSRVPDLRWQDWASPA